MVDVSKEHIDKAAHGIMNGFVWVTTLQGKTYWRTVFTNLVDLGAQDYAQAGKIPEGGRPDLIRLTTQRLQQSFRWSGTKQGHHYWQMVSMNLLALIGEEADGTDEQFDHIAAYDRAMMGI